MELSDDRLAGARELIDDKMNLSGRVADDSPDRPERFGVKVEYWHTDEIADSCRLRKAL